MDHNPDLNVSVELEKLTDEQIEQFLNDVHDLNDYNTDDESEFSDSEDEELPDELKEMFERAVEAANEEPTIEQNKAKNDQLPPGFSSEEVGVGIDMEIETEEPLVPEIDHDEDEPGLLRPSTCGTFTGDPMNLQVSANFKKAVWKNKHLQIDSRELKFGGMQPNPEELEACLTTYDYFMYFIKNDLLNDIAFQTNYYAAQKDIATSFKVTDIDIRQI